MESYLFLHYFFFLNLFIYFTWSLITLQYRGGFCHILTWISHGCICVPYLKPPTYIPPHPFPLGCPSAPALSALIHASNLHWSSILHMVVYMFQCYSLKLSPLSPSEQCRGFDQGKELYKSQVGGGGGPRERELKGQSQQGWDTMAANWLHLAYLWSILDIFPDLWVPGVGSHHQPISRTQDVSVLSTAFW